MKKDFYTKQDVIKMVQEEFGIELKDEHFEYEDEETYKEYIKLEDTE